MREVERNEHCEARNAYVQGIVKAEIKALTDNSRKGVSSSEIYTLERAVYVARSFAYSSQDIGR